MTSTVSAVGPDPRTGERLGAARRQAHLTQRELAAELGVTVRTLQNYEAGRFVPYRHLHRLTELLNRPAHWILYGDPDVPDADEATAQ